MRRRLTLALVGTALFAVIFVGVGVLVFAGIGARQEARDDVSQQLDALVELVDSLDSIEQLGRTLNRFGQAFDIRDLDIVVVSDDGAVSPPPNRDRPLPPVVGQLAEGQLETLADGDPVFLDDRGTVIGIQTVDLADDRPFFRNSTLAVLIRQDVAALPTSARQWFLISAAIVIAASAILAAGLAGRFSAPIRRIEQATASIAAGDLATRVDVSGTDEVADLGNAVNRMATDLQRSKALEQQFLLSVSHDLKTPLTAISGYAEALTDGAVEDPAHSGTIIQNHARRLDRLVGDLLDLARLDAKAFQVDLRSVDPTEVVGRAVAGHQPLATGYGIELRYTGAADLMIAADPDRLSQIVGNLIDNAMKYADDFIEVEVAASAESVSITVRDDGPGIPPEDLPHVFERLYVTQLAPRREESSNGLGLAIVRELARAMGGSVEARSHIGGARGTTMVVSLPRSNASQAEGTGAIDAGAGPDAIST